MSEAEREGYYEEAREADDGNPSSLCDMCGDSPDAGERLYEAVDTEGAKLWICPDCIHMSVHAEDCGCEECGEVLEDEEPCFACGADPCACPESERCPECGHDCAKLCIDDTCRKGECCCDCKKEDPGHASPKQE